MLRLRGSQPDYDIDRARLRPLAGAARRRICPAAMTPFVKMHGLGNDFVVLDARGGSVLDARGGSVLDARAVAPAITPAKAAAIADRRFGI
ncbi:MAG: hypothetical protein ACOYOH_28060, partial [Paracraurococcus sp.]